jgi:hypothetical protein
LPPWLARRWVIVQDFGKRQVGLGIVQLLGNTKE